VASYQEKMIGIVGQDPGIPISLAVYRFLRGSVLNDTVIDDASRRFAYGVVAGAISGGEIIRIKEGPSVRLYPARQEIRP